MMVRGKKLLITLLTGIFGCVSQINTHRISILIFRSNKASYGECRHVCILLMLPYLCKIYIEILWVFICERWPSIPVVFPDIFRTISPRVQIYKLFNDWLSYPTYIGTSLSNPAFFISFVKCSIKNHHQPQFPLYI